MAVRRDFHEVRLKADTTHMWKPLQGTASERGGMLRSTHQARGVLLCFMTVSETTAVAPHEDSAIYNSK